MELRYTYLLDVKDRASRLIAQANARVTKSVEQSNVALRQQGTVAQSAAAKVQAAGARQAAEWQQVARAARTAEREVATAATTASSAVTRATEKQVAAQRAAGASYQQIARAQKAAGMSARETAAAIEQSAAREQKAMTASSGAARKHSGVLGGLRSQLKGFGGMAAGLGATFAAFKGLDFLRESVNDVESLARSTIKLQKITGQDATTASSWIQVAKQRGLTAQQLSRAFVTLEKNQVKGAAGAKTQAEAFRTLGISQEQLKRSNPQQLILAVADGMKNLENPSKRAAAAQALFGRAGVSLIATLSGGSQAIRDQLEVVQKYGASLDKNGVKNAMKLVAEQRKLSLAMDGVKLSIGQALVPLLARGAKALATFVSQMRQGKGAGGQVRRAFEQMADGAKSVWSAIGPAVKALATFARQHPGLVKVAGGIVAIGVGLRALRFASAISGATTLLGVLGKLGKVSMGGSAAGAGAGVGAGRLATYAALTSRIGALVIASLAARKGLTDLTAQANKSHSGVARVLGKVGEFVHTVGWKPIEAAAGRLKRTFDQLSGITPKLAQVSQRTTERLQQILGRSQGLNLAKTFAAEANSAGHATAGMVNRIVAQLGRLKGDARVEARKAIDGMLAQMVRGGTLTASAAAKLRRGITGAFGPLKDDLGGAARRGIRAITREFGKLPGGITNPLRLSLSQVRTYMGRILDVTNATVSQLRTMRALLAAGIEPVAPRTGSKPRRSFGTNRTGGIVGRYQGGGMVPAMVSPGELIVHGNAGMVVPGRPVAADTVPMLLPTGSAVLTGHGQQLLAQGATISQAVAAQAPHFAKGGFVKVGATVYNDPPPGAYGGSLSMGYAELGTARRTDGGGTGRGWLARALGRRGELPENYPLRVSRRPDGAGRVAILRKRDRGYGQGGDGRTSDPAYAIDIWRDAWSNLGISGSFKGPVWVQPTTGKLPASTPGTGGGARSVSGLAQAMSRRVGRSVKRAGLVDDAFGSGFAQGEAGLTRQRLRYTADTAARDIAAAYRLPASKTVSVPGAKAAASGGGAGSYGGARGPMVTWEGKRMRSWLAHALAYARDKGWRGSVNQGLRSHAEQVRLWNGAPGNGLVRGVSVARPGQSRHESGNAVDVSPPGPGLLRYFRGYRGMRPRWMGERDRVHYSDTGHRKGGWIGAPIRLRAGTGSVGGPVQVGRVIRQETTGPGIPAFGKRLQDAVERALTWQAGTFEKLNTAVQRSAEAKLGALRNRLQAAVRRGGTEAAVKRLQAALDLVDKELGRRAGLLARRVTQRAASADRAQARSEIGLRLAGTDPESAPGLAARLRVEAAKGRGLHRTARDLDGELRLARRAHDLDRIADLKTQIADNQTAILESRASQKELARARAQAMRDARTAFAASLTDIASSRVSLAQTGLQRVELEQRLAGTYDTGGRARADYITQSVIPQLQAERDQIRAQGVEAMRQNNAELARAMRQAWEEKGNDILQALLDVKDATETTASNTDPLKSLGGQLAFEFGGSRLTDDLLASSVGA